MSQTFANRGWFGKRANNKNKKDQEHSCPCCCNAEQTDQDLSSLADENTDENSTEGEFTEDFRNFRKTKSREVQCSEEEEEESLNDEENNPGKKIKPSLAIGAIEKLRELQWRRDQLERHYTFEIRRILDEVYFPDGIIGDSFRKSQRKTMQKQRISQEQRDYPVLVELPCGCIHHCRRPEKLEEKGASSSLTAPETSNKSTLLPDCPAKTRGKSCTSCSCDEKNSKAFSRKILKHNF